MRSSLIVKRLISYKIRNSLNLRCRPSILYWSITTRCNLKCKFCDVWKCRESELSTDQAKKVLKDLIDFGVVYINIDGGEPLVRKDLEEIAKICRDYGVWVGVNTNGTLITQERARSLSRVFDTIMVSLDGFKKTHDYFRGPNTFNLAIKGLKNLINQSVNAKIGVNFVVSASNHKEMIRFFEYVRKLGVDYVSFQPINDPFPFGSQRLKLFRKGYLSKEDTQKLTLDLLDYKRKNKNFVIPSEEYIELLPVHFNNTLKICDAGKIYIYLNPNGDISPCPRVRIKFGNLLEQPISTLWKPELFQEIIRRCPGCMLMCTTHSSLMFNIGLRKLVSKMKPLIHLYTHKKSMLTTG